MATCAHLRGKMKREAVFLLAWNKRPMGIFRCIWPFGSNQWPRNQNSLVLISSRAVTIIGRGGSMRGEAQPCAASTEKTPTGFLCPTVLCSFGKEWVSCGSFKKMSPLPHLFLFWREDRTPELRMCPRHHRRGTGSRTWQYGNGER